MEPRVTPIVTFVDECMSTNAAIPADAPHGFALAARSQTAGRGQRGSSWESEPGMNVTMSVVLRPQAVSAREQFAISVAAALAVAETLDEFGVVGAEVKWPNDIYVGNRKICGILIENSLSGSMVGRSIVGIGLNVNQTEFRSPAPNPVSMKQLTGVTYPVEQVAQTIVSKLLNRPLSADFEPYMKRLWRGKGVWPWVSASGEKFSGEISGVCPSGHLIIGDRRFAFKEVWPADITDPSRQSCPEPSCRQQH